MIRTGRTALTAHTTTIANVDTAMTRTVRDVTAMTTVTPGVTVVRRNRRWAIQSSPCTTVSSRTLDRGTSTEALGTNPHCVDASPYYETRRLAFRPARFSKPRLLTSLPFLTNTC